MEEHTSSLAGEQLADDLRAYIARALDSYGGVTAARKPGHRVKFSWPPHPESYSFHVLPTDWTGRSSVVIDGERFAVEIAKSPGAVFGRVPELWFEAKGKTEGELERNLIDGVQPLINRQKLIAQTLERAGRFTEPIGNLSQVDLLKLFYCEDRDVANDGRREVETHASHGSFLPSLLVILLDQTHPFRRSAQWAVLDLFEDLSSFCHTEAQSKLAIEAIKGLVWDAPDDYARTIYKAGVVLGGHLPYGLGGNALLDCLCAPSKIGRRSAIHGSFHLAEWAPEKRSTILDGLEGVVANDPEQMLRDYAKAMIEDIVRGDTIHIEDVTFAEEEIG